MAKYFVLAVLFAGISFGASSDNNHGTACGLGVASGLCILAAAIVESRGRKEENRESD